MTAPPKLLYIEDSHHSIRLLKKAFSKERYYIIAAKDGQTGIAQAVAMQPDIIVLDMNLPDIDGVMVATRLKADLSTSHIPIVILTAYTSHELRKTCMEIGCTDFLNKPISRRKLVRVVSDVLYDGDRYIQSGD